LTGFGFLDENFRTQPKEFPFLAAPHIYIHPTSRAMIMMVPFLARNSAVDSRQILTQGKTSAILDGCIFDEQDARQMEHTLASSTTLQSLHMFGTRWTSATAFVHVAEGLAKSTSLQVLYLCGDSHVDWTVLGRAIANNQSIRELHLWNNQLNDKDAIEFASFLHTNQSLVKLDVSRNYMGSAGANALIQASNQGTTIQELHLAHNHIRQVHLHQINSLRALHLDANVTLDIQLIADAMATNIGLEELSLTQCQVTTAAFLPLAHSLRTNSHLKTLTIHNKNQLDCKAEVALCQVLRESNYSLLHTDMPKFPTLLHYLQFNQSGRRLLAAPPSTPAAAAAPPSSPQHKKIATTTTNPPPVTVDALWPLVLTQISNQPALLYEYLKEKPDWCRR
jgi:hypothetical protein